MNRLLSLMIALLAVLAARSETVYLYNDNGKGGIHKTVARLVVDEGQYFVEVPKKSYSGKVTTERFKVYRIWDDAYHAYHQPRWAQKYVYVATHNDEFRWTGVCYYFNMKSKWLPSLTKDPDDPYRIIPVKWIVGYYDNDGAMSKKRILLVKTQGKYGIYGGRPIRRNDRPNSYDPAWTRRFRYYSDQMPPVVYFNL